jgi:hypothetical protein
MTLRSDMQSRGILAAGLLGLRRFERDAPWRAGSLRPRRVVAAGCLALLVAGCVSSASPSASGCEDMRRPSTPAPRDVDPPTGVGVTVEELIIEEPVAEDASVELDPVELRESWRKERLERAGGVIEQDPDTGRLLHRFDAVVVRWDEPRFEEANAFFLEADGHHVSAFDTNDEVGTWGVEATPQDMSFTIEQADLLDHPGASWTLRSGWAHYGWYLPPPCGTDVIRSTPVGLELAGLDPGNGARAEAAS